MIRRKVRWVVRGGFLRPTDKRVSLKSVAHHEAAHAVIAEVCGAQVQRVVIRDYLNGFSEAAYRKRRGKIDPVVRGVVSMAGHEAEVRFYGRPIRMLPRGDYEAVRSLGCSDDSVNALGEIARRLVRWHAPRIRRVAKALLKRGQLNRRQFLKEFRA
jgi:hypothetical protein